MRWGLAICAALVPAPAQAMACKLALVLALDISSSVNMHEYRIQLHGLADAFRVPQVREAILTPPGTGIAVYAFEWSGEVQQTQIAPWTLLGSAADIDAFADRLLAHTRSEHEQPTAIGRALEHAGHRLAEAPDCGRKAIDISGDGVNNDGPEAEDVRASGLLDGVTINGLVIQGAADDPVIYYRAQVMQGPNAFVALARDFDDYRPVIVGKLLREIEQEMFVGQAPEGKGQ